jgi:thioredoxin-like negative regulator of GroEL
MTEFTDCTHEELAVVCFHSTWCKACKKFQVLYRKLDVSNPRGVRLANVEYGKNAALSKMSGVTKLPTVQFYHKGKRLDSFSCGPKSFPRVLGTIQSLLDQVETQQLDERAELLRSELDGHLRSESFDSSSPSLPSSSSQWSVSA